MIPPQIVEVVPRTVGQLGRWINVTGCMHIHVLSEQICLTVFCVEDGFGPSGLIMVGVVLGENFTFISNTSLQAFAPPINFTGYLNVSYVSIDTGVLTKPDALYYSPWCVEEGTCSTLPHNHNSAVSQL